MTGHYPRGRWFSAVVPAVFLCGAMMVSTPTFAQQAAGIAGLVTDSDGLPVPGVSVETFSPVLIEKTRTVFTDGEGRYNIVDLRAGEFVLTFSLQGFTTVRREGVVLTSGFTAAVNASMKVGTVEETITVTAAASVVDTQAMRQQETLSTSQLQALPTGSIGLQTLAAVTPGFGRTRADVGGTRDTWSAQGAYTFFRGKPGTRASFDGFRNQYFVATATGVGYVTDQGVIEELQLETSGMGAEVGGGTTNLNMIPRSGGNVLRATVEGFFSNNTMQSTNLDDELKALGARSGNEVVRIWRASAQLGGPLVRDRVWFFAAIGRWGARNHVPGGFFNPLQGQSGNPQTGTLFYPGQPGTPYANVSAGDFPGLRQAAQFDWSRYAFDADDVAGDLQTAGGLLFRHPEGLPVHDGLYRGKRDRGGPWMGLDACRRGTRDLDGAGDEPVAGGSGTLVADGELGELPHLRYRDEQRPVDPGARDQFPVRRTVRTVLGAGCADGAKRGARFDGVCNGQPQLQSWIHLG